MLKVSSILTERAVQSLSLLSDCSVNNALVRLVPFLNQSFFQIITVTDQAAARSLLRNAQSQQAISGNN